MFWRQRRSKVTEPEKEPLFIAVRSDSPEMQRAYAHAAETIPAFQAFVSRSGKHMCCAKLRFRDPDLSERLGEDRFIFLWLNDVSYNPEERLFSGTFFELPQEFTKWHHVGERLGFSAGEIFDWMVNDQGHLYGGFSMRVAREHLSEPDRASYDRYAGVSVWEELPPA